MANMYTLNSFVIVTISVVYICLMVQAQMTDYIYQSYQRSVTCVSQFPPREPRNLSEIQDIVRYASARNLNLKVIGNRHSISDCICTDGIPVNLSHITHFSYNPKTKTAIGGAGLEVGDFFEKMHEFGRGISGAPTFAGITLGGAIAIGVYGTGLRYPSSLSEQIVSMTVVDGRGQILKITKDEEDFKAFRVNLGLLGIVYEVEIATQPQYKLHVRHFPISDKIIYNGTDLVKIAREHDTFQFWWFPTSSQLVLGIGSRVPVHQTGNCETRYIPNISWLTSNAFSVAVEAFQAAKDDIGLFHVQSYAKLGLYKEVPGRDPIFVEEDGETPCLETAIGYGHRMISNKCRDCAWDRGPRPLTPEEGNIVIPLNKLMPAMRTLGEIFKNQLVQFPLNGIYFRFLRTGDAYMAVNGGGSEWVSIEWVTVPRWDRSQPMVGISAYQIMGQILVKQYGGRPHWAKNGFYYSNPKIIHHAYPHLDKFVAAMDKYDPKELFINTFGERIKYGKEEYTVSANIMQHCALNEVCICKTNHDCGNEGALDYTCGDFPGFPRYNVCLPNALENMKSVYSRAVIATMAALEYNEDSIMNYLEQYKVMSNVFANKKKKIGGETLVDEVKRPLKLI